MTFTPAGSDAEAKALVERMLRVNEPWLNPKPISARYSLHRSYHNYSVFHGHRQTEEDLGPYLAGPRCKAALRVGSIMHTPLHEMINQPTNYSVKMVGSAKWKGRTFAAVDVTFGKPIHCQVGLGGQGRSNYSLSQYQAEGVRLFIDPGTAVPVLLRTSARLNVPTNPVYETWWEFAPVFFKLGDGLVPQAFDWRDNENNFREHQQFQILNGVWIFDQGRAVIPGGSGIRPRGLSGMVGELLVCLNSGRSDQILRLTNFTYTVESQRSN
ncbi:MAG: hypothetical protein ACLQU3_25725 [Limisphaerales bacterium]